jgi:hypothetical protein
MSREVTVWSRIAAVALTAGLVGMVGCKPQVGGKCSQNGTMSKLDGVSVLSCVNGVYTKLPCRGPKGASGTGSHMECDDSIASDGDTCLPENNSTAACSVDRKSFLICSANASGAATFGTKTQCRGPKQCSVTGDEVSCDTSLQSVNDPCDQPGVGTCSEDKKRRLVCRDSKWQVDRFCRGANGCSTNGREVDCDESMANPGDPCGISGLACSNDGKTELSCIGGKFTPKRACKNWCRILANKTLDCE